MEQSSLDATVVEADVMTREIGPAIDSALADAAKIAASIVDDDSRERAVSIGVLVKERMGQAEAWREKYYDPLYRAAEGIREFCDPKIKTGKAILKTLSAGVSEYDRKKQREADLARERAEAEARRIREEAERKIQEAKEAERKAKEAEEAEKRRKAEAAAAEERRIQAEKEAAEKAERERRVAEQAELDRKRKEEEDARIKHAEVAQEVGNGAAKVDTILESPTPISGVVASPQLDLDKETLRISQDLAAKVAAEKAEAERLASEEAARKQAEATEAARVAKEAAEKAIADAATANAAAEAAGVIAKRPDDRTRKTVTWKWQIRDEKAFRALLKAILENRAPIEYAGFDPLKPEKFRPACIGSDVTREKENFRCDGIETWPHEETHFKVERIYP